MTTAVFVDAETAAKAWARATAAISAIFGQRVFLGVTTGSFPQLVVGRVAGAPDPGPTPVDYPVISFSSWATSRAAAAAGAYAVLSAAEAMTDPTPMGADAVGMGAHCLLGPLYLTSQPDEQAKRYRYVCDIQFAIKAA